MKRLLAVAGAFLLVLAVGTAPAFAAEHSQIVPRVRSAAGAPRSFGTFTPSAKLAPGRLPIGPAVAGGGADLASALELPGYDPNVPSTAPSGTVDSVTRPHDVYWFFLEKGATVGFKMTPGTPGSQIALNIYSPYATSLAYPPVLSDTSYSYPYIVQYTAPIGGYYYVDVQAVTGSSSYLLEYGWWHDNDDIPGVAAQPSPIFSALQYDWNWDDVSRFPLRAGDKLALSAAPVASWLNTTDFDLDLYLHGPSSASVVPQDPAKNAGIVDWAAHDAADTQVEAFTYSAPVSGSYYADVYDYLGNGTAFLSWKVTASHPSIKRSPSSAKLSYKRKSGKAKFTLSATFSNGVGLQLGATKVILQTSSNAKKWKSSYSLTTNAQGVTSKAFSVKKKGVTYYRWAVKNAGAKYVYSGAQKVTIK